MTPGYILHLPADRRQLFEEYREQDRPFGQPVPMFSYSRNFPLLLLISTRNQTITHIARGTGGNTGGSGLRLLKMTRIEEVDLTITELIDEAQSKFKRLVQRCWDQGGFIPGKTFQELLRCIYKVEPDLEGLVKSYLNKSQSLSQLSQKAIQSLGDQKEAVSTALHLADIDRTPLQTWSAPSLNKPGSFLDGLDSVYMLEDTMINADMRRLPGFNRISETHYGAARFASKDERTLLDVIVANRTTLEQQTGADLIYYNERYQSFIFVQYKAMEKEAGTGDVFRLPNTQLTKEITSMRNLLAHIGTADPQHRNEFRFMYNPFYVKLCSRIVFNPQDLKLTAGMYFNLDQWEFLERDADLRGPKGGRFVSYKNVGRHINNTDFAALVNHSWIGTTPAQSALIEPLIREILSTGKSVVYAINRDSPAITNHLSGYYDPADDEEELPF